MLQKIVLALLLLNVSFSYTTLSEFVRDIQAWDNQVKESNKQNRNKALNLLKTIAYKVYYRGQAPTDNEQETKPGETSLLAKKLYNIQCPPPEIADYILQLKILERRAKLNLDLPRGLLLHGPTGTGKTTLARTIAQETGFEFVEMLGAEYADKYMGEEARKIRELFERIKKSGKPTILLLDEIDAFASSHAQNLAGGENLEYTRSFHTLNTQLSNLDSAPVFVVGTTNHYHQLPPELIRAGRFDTHVQVPLPDAAARLQIINYYAKLMPNSLTPEMIEELAQETDGFSGAEIKNLLHRAGEKALRMDTNTNTISGELIKTVFNQAIQKRKAEFEELAQAASQNEERWQRMHTPQVNVTVPTPNVNFEAGSFAPSFNLEVPDDLHPTQLPQQQPQQSSDVDWNYIENVDVSFNDWIGKRPEMVDEMVSSFRRVIEGKESWQNLPARGLLLYGPPGTGKSKLAQAIAGALNVPFIGIGADQLSQKYIGEGAKTVRRIFAQARALDKYVILFIDEIDAAARKRGTENTHAEDERTLDALLQVITEPQNEKILIIGATNNKNTIDSAAKRSGRLTSVEINAPDKKGIEDIFEYYLGKVGTRTSFDWKQSLATMKGFTGADIESLIKWATAYTRNHSGSIITQDSFNKALGIVKQAKRDTEYTFECIKPEDITYEEIVEANLPKLTADLINYFINLDKYKNAKIQIPRGMLLYGTPGTGKSTLAKHIAKKSGLDLISINGSDLCEKYREGAKCVTALFEQARSLEKPVIIAIDEIDSAGKKKSDGATQEDQIVLNALARELENPKNSSVFVIGTTNYKDSIEPALIRPGRIDFIIPMKLPNPQMRVRLLVAQLQRLFGSTVNLKNAMGHIDQQLDEKSLMAAVLKVANIALTPAKITNLFGDKKIFDPRDVFFINQLINYGMVLGLKCDDILELTDKMEYFSPSDIKSLAETASLLAKLRDINAKPNKKDFDDAIDLQKVKVEGKLDKTENFFKKFALNFIPGAQTFKEARYGKYADLASELCP